MKTIKLISAGLILFFTMIFMVQCSDDPAPAPVEPAPLVKISGKVTFTNEAGTAANAAGAIVYLAKGATATTNFDQTTIANANGDYEFVNLDTGSYYLNATFYTANKNVTGRLDGLNFTTEAGAVVAAAADVTQNLTLVSVGQSGSTLEVLGANYAWDPNALAADGVTPAPKFVNTGTWTYDATHSPIAFEFSYRANEADFIGAFPQLSKFNVNFDPANLSTSTIDVEVDVASINTRAPGGRDNTTTVAINPSFNPASLFTKLGCIMGTFGITADGGGTPTEAAPLLITEDPDRYAQFTSTSIAKFGDGYVAKGNLVFHGFTVPIDLWFKAVPAWLDASNNRKYSGFEGKFLMDAKNDFGITSTSVNDAIIRIQISIVLYKQL
ncbi:MAG: YceI family protein [Bacteroidota bacterium]